MNVKSSALSLGMDGVIGYKVNFTVPAKNTKLCLFLLLN